MRTILRIAFFAGMALTGYGQQADPSVPDKKVWTLVDCINHAYKNNISVKQNELTVLNNELNYRQAKVNRLPNLNANTSVTNSGGRSIDPFTNDVVNRDVTSQSYGLNSSVTLFDGFGQVSSIQQNKANLHKSQFDLEDVKNTTALNISSYYLNILLTREQFRSAQLSLETSKHQLENTRKQFNAGALAQKDLLQVTQQVANDEVNLITAENNLDLAQLTLKQALQLPAETDMEIEVPQLNDPSEEILSVDLTKIYEDAQRLPSVKSAEEQVLSSKYGINVARSGRYPSLSLSGGLSTSYSSAAPDEFPDPSSPSGVKENTYFNQLDFNQRTFVSLQLNIPIFNRFQNNINVGLAKLSLQNSEYLQKNVKNQLRQNVEQSFYNARAALKTYQATKKQVEALGESFRNVNQRFELGAANSLEYTQIKNDLNKAQNDLIRAKYDFIFKMKVLDFYQGKPLGL